MIGKDQYLKTKTVEYRYKLISKLVIFLFYRNKLFTKLEI